MAMDGVGGFVVIWSNGDIVGLRYDSSGSPIGPVFQVNTYTTGSQKLPSVSMDAAGDFVVAWTSSSGQDGDGYGVFAQRFDAAAVRQGGEFQVNTYTTGLQYRPSVATNGLGNFVVAWSGTGGQDGSGIFAQRFDSDGSASGVEFQVNTYTSGGQFAPSLAMDPFGTFVVVWTSKDQDGSGEAVIGRRYDSSGAPDGDEFQVNAYTTDNQRTPSVATNPAGEFVVAWTSKDSQDGSAYGVFGRRYDSAGVPQGLEFQVNTYTTGYQVSPSIAMDDLGRFFVTWLSNDQTGVGGEVFGRRFNESGTPIGPDFLVNAYTTGGQVYPAVAASPTGTFVIAWTSYGTEGHDGAFARLAFPLSATQLRVDVHSTGMSNLNGILEPGEVALIEPGWSNEASAAVDLKGTASSFTGPNAPGGYTIQDDSADYGTLNPGSSDDCFTAMADCYQMAVSGPRPATHWDATFVETFPSSAEKTWTLHVGESFSDVLTTHPFYGFVENLFHNRVTTGCSATGYCPGNVVTRAQMAVFLLKAKHGPDFTPPPCLGFFTDVDCPSPFADWVEQLAAEGVTAGCGGGFYCPTTPVRRDQMAAFLLKSEHGSSYTPPSCSGVFGDVACPSLFADWVEQLAAEQVTGGCGNGNYCPLNQITRGQMAVFLVKTFGLQLYGP